MQPAIPADFVGNVVSMYAAQVRWLNSNVMMGWLLWLVLLRRFGRVSWAGMCHCSVHGLLRANSLPSDNVFQHPSGSVVAPNILTTDHTKCDTCGLHWGVLGRVESIRGIGQDYPFPTMALCFFMSALADGGLEIASVFDNHVNEDLEKDEVFARYAELRLGSCWRCS
jgi:hypothetical protein